MARWEPGAPERLEQAALELFATQTFEQTTATEIARSVGLTERTFFRHFSDKREVLFHGRHQLVEAFLAGVAAAPPDASAMEIVASCLSSAASFFPAGRRQYARLRQSVIDQNPALQEREVHKFADIASALADALRARGVEDLRASLAAESGISVFGIAFARWIRQDEQRHLADIQTAVLHELAILAGSASTLRVARPDLCRRDG